MSATVLPLVSLFARVAAPWADDVVEGMARRLTRLAAICVDGDTADCAVYGPRAVWALAGRLGLVPPALPPTGAYVLVVTPRACAWVSVTDLATAEPLPTRAEASP
jgi:hypothetical protein